MSLNTIREDEQVQASLKMETIKRLIRYLKPYRIQVVQVLFLIGIVTALDLLNPYFLKVAIDTHIAQGDIPGLFLLGGLMILGKIIGYFCLQKRIGTMSAVTNRILLTIRQDLFTHIQSLPLSFFNHRPVGKILARVIGDVNSLNDLFSHSVTTLIPDLMTIVAVMGIMLSINWQLALFSFITLPFLFFFMGVMEVISHRRWQIYRQKRSNVHGFTHENFSGIRVVQSFSAQEKTEKNFTTLLRDTLSAFVRAIRLNDTFWPSVEMSWGLGTIAVFWYGIRLLHTGTITIGLLVAFTGYIAMFWHPVMKISNFYNILVTNLSGAERIFEIMDMDPSIQNASDAMTLPLIKGHVAFEDVTFGYEEGQVVLDRVRFTVEAGETLALVGPTGAGKTSIINLLSRFYEPQAGRICIDGYDLQMVRLESLRSQMGTVLQDTFLFSGSIKDNIRYGRLDATDDEVIAAAQAVFAHDCIMKLEHGYETRINERGGGLSFGQRQQIAFARALLADPRILILDEATSGIDTFTERRLQKGLETLLQDRTSIVIAHRLSTIRNADRILVMQQGRIVEMGNHASLMKARGPYYQLFMAQYTFLDEEKTLSSVSV